MRLAQALVAVACGAHLVQVAPVAAEVAIVIESHVGERPPDAARVTAPITEELARFGYLGDVRTTGEAYERTTSRPGLATWRSAAEITTKAELGYEAYISGRFAEAVTSLVPLLAEIRASPAIIAWQPRIRHAIYKASVATAISLMRLGRDTAGLAEMAELLRSYPDEPVTRAIHGPEAEALYAQAIGQTKANGRGTLHIIAEPTAHIYLNERLVATNGEAKVTDLSPGTYRAYAQRGSLPGRLYVVDVDEGSSHTLCISGAFDRLIHTTPYWTGLLFRDELERIRLEPASALRFGAELGADKIIVLAITKQDGRPMLIGTAIDGARQAILRTASLALAPDPTVSTLQAFARFLAQGGATSGFWGDGSAIIKIDAAAGILADATEPSAATRSSHDTEPRARRDRRWMPYAALGGSIATAAAATYFFIYDGKGTCAASACVYSYEYTAAALGTTAVSAALGALSVVGFAKGWHRRRHIQAISAAASAEGVALGVIGRF